jgi:membrane-associated phospholipid phosphatase
MHRQTRTQLRSRSAAGRCSAVVVRKSTCVAAALAGLLFIHPVAAQDPVPLKLGLYPERVEEPLEWRGRELHALDYVAAGALAMGAIVEWSLPSGEDPKRTGGILFDESLRNGLKLDDAAGRAGADMWSDLMFVVLTAYPAVVDAGATAALYHKRPEVARNMLVIDLQAFAFTSLTTGFLKRVADRERPIASECRTDPDHDPSCDTAGKHYSFPSGHTSMAFTGASLVCLHHAELGLLSTAGDAVSCVSAMTLATSVGGARIAADKHYATDVLSGAAIGVLSGAVIPYLLYYLPGRGAPHVALGPGVVTPAGSESFIGAAYVGAL